MLGTQHVSITLATIFPFLIPILSLGNGDYLLIFGSVIIASVVGSLTPDAYFNRYTSQLCRLSDNK